MGTSASTPESTSSRSKKTSLETFIRKVLIDGSHGRVPGPIAEMIAYTKDSPTFDFELPLEQTTDGMSHLFQVTIKRLPGTNAVQPAGLVLMTTHEWPGHFENYLFRASLDGRLEKVKFVHGKLNERGESNRGGVTAQGEDINSLEIKERFRHEMDLWLKKTYLKKEWRSAEFSNGVLNKTSGTQ